MASGYAVLEANRDAGTNELAKALVADMETSEGRSAAQDGLNAQLTGKSPAEIKQQAIATLTRVGQILDAKAPAEGAAFKAWLIPTPGDQNPCAQSRSPMDMIFQG